MLAVLGGLADVERDLIRTRTAEGRSRAKAQGRQIGPPPSLTHRHSKKRPHSAARGALRCKNWRTAITSTIRRATQRGVTQYLDTAPPRPKSKEPTTRFSMTNASPASPLSPELAAQIGMIPVKRGPVRFAVGSPDGITSNSWKVLTHKGNVYVSCRDNFQEAKVSLHASGRWRMGFTETAVHKNVKLLSPGRNRAWQVWDRPPPSLPNTVIAFRLVFPTSELGIRLEQRAPSKWKDVIYIEAAPPGKLAVVTLFVTIGDVVLRADSEPSFCLASMDMGNNNQHAQLVAHGMPEGDLPTVIDRTVVEALSRSESRGIEVPSEAYLYILGQLEDGSRYLVGARAQATRQERGPR
jgi:hypothetical protein